MKKVQYFIRILTVAPIIALATFLILQIVSPEITGGWLNTSFGILFITIFPALAYAIQPIIPHFKNKGREGQRTLAIIMSVIGYIGGAICAFALRMPEKFQIIFVTYLLSGVIMLLLNKVAKIRSSGHACGVAGPVFYLSYVYTPFALFGLLLLVPVFWSSCKMKRHKISELVIGTAIPLFSMILSILFVSIA